MRNIKIIIAFDGTNYGGWQIQKNAVTVEEKIETAIKKITGEEVKVTGSSRTDSGVHAEGFVANFFTNSKIPGEKFKYAINSRLPSDIIVLSSEEAEENFHARYSSKGKTYYYKILNRELNSPHLRLYSYHYKEELDIFKMKEGAKFIVGKHDFSAFKSTGTTVKNTVRTIYSLNIEKRDEEIIITVTGDGFLYNMVRIIVGTLIEVGRGKIEPIKVKDIIESKDRKKAGPSVPPQGLFLKEVYY